MTGSFAGEDSAVIGVAMFMKRQSSDMGVPGGSCFSRYRSSTKKSIAEYSTQMTPNSREIPLVRGKLF